MAWGISGNIKGPQGIQGLQGNPGGAADVASVTDAAISKTTPVNADELPLVDSAASFGLKKLTWANLVAAVKSYYDSVASTLTNKNLTSGTNTFPTFNQSTTGTAAGITGKTTPTGALVGTTDSQAFTNKMLTDATNVFPTLNQSTTGNAATATKLATARTINGVSFDGSANITITPHLTTIVSSATPTVTVTGDDILDINALAVAVTGVTVTGTPGEGWRLLIRWTDNGTARAITHGTSFIASGQATPVNTTVVGKTVTEGYIYDATKAAWVCMAADASGY